VPGVGHSIIGGDPSGCGRRQLLRFVAGEAVRARCPRVPTGVPETTVPPTSFRAVAPARGLRGRVGRTVGAIDATLDFVAFALSPAIDFRGQGGGLRGGSYTLRRRLVLDDVVVVPGVRIGGRELRGGTVRLRVRGSAAARGTVVVSRRGRLSGRLGGRRVRARLENGAPGPLAFGAAATARTATVTPPPARP
jgi:hypothetical protein